MYKIVSFLKRKPGLSMAEFIDYYETSHARLGERLMGRWVTHYSRRFVLPVEHPLDPSSRDAVPPCDVIMELWFESREDFEASLTSLTPEGIAEMLEDEARFLDKTEPVRVFHVEEHVSTPENLVAS